MISQLKRASLFAFGAPLAVVGLVVLGGCGGGGGDNDSRARFVNGIYGTTSTLSVNGTAFNLNGTTATTFSTATFYTPIPTAADTFSLSVTSFPSITPSVSETPASSTRYTMFAFGRTDVSTTDPRYPVLNWVTDDRTVPGTGNTRLRVINGAPDLGAIDVYRNGSKFVSSLGYDALQGYAEFGGGNYTLTVTPAGSTTPATTTSVPLSTGDLYTLVVLEANPTSATPTYTTLVINDSAAG